MGEQIRAEQKGVSSVNIFRYSNQKPVAVRLDASFHESFDPQLPPCFTVEEMCFMSSSCHLCVNVNVEKIAASPPKKIPCSLMLPFFDSTKTMVRNTKRRRRFGPPHESTAAPEIRFREKGSHG